MAQKDPPIQRPDLDELVGAIRALADEGSPASLRVVCLVDRLLRDDWTSEGVYDLVEEALDDAEKKVGAREEDTILL